jgi:hypothetical protein
VRKVNVNNVKGIGYAGMDSTGLVPMAGSLKHDNECSGTIKCVQYLAYAVWS